MSGLLQHPEWLEPITAALLATLLILAASRYRARRRAHRLLGASAASLPSGAGSDLLLFAALVCVAAAWLGPRLGERTVMTSTSGVDVVVLLDVSRSMDARDVPPSRMVRARHAAAQTLAGLEPGDRAALAAFAGRGVLLTPLTPDIAALIEMLPALDTDLIRPGASALGGGVRAALEAFEADSARPRVLLVLGDGEDPEASGDTGVPEAIRADARVIAVALGNEEGATIPSGDEALRDAHGRIVTSRRDITALRALASATDGSLRIADAWGAIDTVATLAEVRRDAASAPGASVPRRVRSVATGPLALLAFLLLAFEAARPYPRARPRPAHTLVAALVAVALAGSAPAQVALRRLPARSPAEPLDATALLHLGLARAESGRMTSARLALLAAGAHAREPGTRALAYYNLGVTALSERDFDFARDAFFDALAAGSHPDHALTHAARFNLEWTLRAMNAKPPPLPSEPRPSPPGESGEGSPESADAGDEPKPAGGEGAAQPPGEAPALPSATKATPPTLDSREAERWLRGVPDDLGRALRGVAREGSPRAGGAPQW